MTEAPYQRSDSELWLAMRETPVKEPLKYEKIDHDIHEWDNIPPIIVKMVLNLNRYMQSTITFMGQTHYELRALQHDVSLIPGQFKQLRDELDVRFDDK